MTKFLPYIVSVGMTVMSGILLAICTSLINDNKKIREQRKEDSEKVHTAIIQAVIQLLRVQLCEYHNKYMEIGNIPTYVYDNWIRMYEQYKTLGGNGMITHMNEDIESLNMKNK